METFGICIIKYAAQHVIKNSFFGDICASFPNFSSCCLILCALLIILKLPQFYNVATHLWACDWVVQINPPVLIEQGL